MHVLPQRGIAEPPVALPRPAPVRRDGAAGERPAAAAERTSPRVAVFPAVALVVSLGVFLIAAADALARSTRGGAQPVFWAGLALIVVPVALRLLSARASRNHGIASSATV